MKIAIIGSREGFFGEDIDNALKELVDIKNDELVTGGARGVDQYAESFFRAFNLPIEIIRPINPSNKMDYLFRNVEIITKADKIIVFWNGYSKGTKFVIDYAKARNKEVKIILSDKTSTLASPTFPMEKVINKDLIATQQVASPKSKSRNWMGEYKW